MIAKHLETSSASWESWSFDPCPPDLPLPLELAPFSLPAAMWVVASSSFSAFGQWLGLWYLARDD